MSCEAQGLSTATRARRLSSIRQLYRFANEEGWRDDNPAMRITGPGASRHLPQTLSQDDVTRIDGGRPRLWPHGGATGCRNLALVELLYATGMRVSRTGRTAHRRGAGRSADDSGQGQGRQGTDGAAVHPRRRRWLRGLTHRDAEDEAGAQRRQARSQVPVPRSRAARPSDAPAFLPADQGHRRRWRRGPCPRHAPHPAPRLCHASSGGWGRSAGDPDPAGPCRSGDDRNLYPCAGGSAERSGPDPPPPCPQASLKTRIRTRRCPLLHLTLPSG